MTQADRSASLIVVPCGRRKIWDKSPALGPVPARDAYTGPAFQQNRRFAERFRPTSWVILSAKYGLILPDTTIPGPYDVTFKDPRTGPITFPDLQEQIRRKKLDRYGCIIALGSKAYRAIVEEAFSPFNTAIVAPFTGLGIGKYLQAVKRATMSGQLPESSTRGGR